MGEKIAKLVLVFGISFILLNIIGYIFDILMLKTIVINPTGGGGRSVSHIPTIISTIISIILFFRYGDRL